MAKCIELYSGSNSLGVNVEVALSESNTWYCREYGWNGFGKGWSKWIELVDDVVRLESTNSQMIEWGFSKLKSCTEFKRRLPQ